MYISSLHIEFHVVAICGDIMRYILSDILQFTIMMFHIKYMFIVLVDDGTLKEQWHYK